MSAPRYLLDTNICSYIIRQRPPELLHKLNSIPPHQLAVSVMTVAELYHGVRKSGSTRINRTVVDSFLQHMIVLDWTVEAADHYADIRVDLESSGQPIGNFDLMIAAHARAEGLIMVSNNLREFQRVPGLRVENWVDTVR